MRSKSPMARKFESGLKVRGKRAAVAVRALVIRGEKPDRRSTDLAVIIDRERVIAALTGCSTVSAARCSLPSSLTVVFSLPSSTASASTNSFWLSTIDCVGSLTATLIWTRPLNVRFAESGTRAGSYRIGLRLSKQQRSIHSAWLASYGPHHPRGDRFRARADRTSTRA